MVRSIFAAVGSKDEHYALWQLIDIFVDRSAKKILIQIRVQKGILNPMGGRPGLPGIAVESAAAAATVAANGGLSPWEFKVKQKMLASVLATVGSVMQAKQGKA